MAMANDLWRECASWLTRCQVIPPDHKANWPDTLVEVLAKTLRDGVLLCNLLNFLDASSLDMRDFNRKPQMAQFLCCQNIKLFLETCKSSYGLRDSELFEPIMLYNLTDFHKVLITLSKVSRSARVAQLHPNLIGFNVPLSPNERSQSDEDIYKDLHSTICNNNSDSGESPDDNCVFGCRPDSAHAKSAAGLSKTGCPVAGDGKAAAEDNDAEESNNDDDDEGFAYEEQENGSSVDIETEADDDECGGGGVFDSFGATAFDKTVWPPEHTLRPTPEHWGWHYNERAYEDLCYVTLPSESTASTSNFEQRDFVIRELIDTETNYLEVLNALCYKFMGPLEKVLSPDDLRAIFPRIKDLADIHERFLNKLRDTIVENSKHKLSAVFLEFREPFLVYGEYCSSMTNAMDTLRDVVKKHPMVDQMIQQCQKEHSGGRSQLRDILSVPMQRILKYHLLLDKLVKETSPMHEDYRGLERAKEAMVDVAQYTNEVKRDSEHLVVINKVKESIVDLNLPNGNDLKQYGHLLLDGDLNLKAHEDQKMKHRYAFIFEKILILVKTSNKMGEILYSFRESHNLADYRVEACHSRRTLGRDARFRYQMLLARKSQATAFTLYMKTEAERLKWTNKLQEAMDALEPTGCRNTDHKFKVTTFDTPVICLHCSKFLKGRIHQGYRCKVCDIAVHKGCISSTGRCRLAVTPTVLQPPPVCDRQLSEFYWFVGAMDRETASTRLENRKIGTYLLRVRPQGAGSAMETMYALSLKTDERVIKHMKINQKREMDTILFYLSSRRHFKTIVELVSFYERNDLGENFAGLNQSLQWPFREVMATALYEFSPTEPNQLPLRQGGQVLVIGKEGDSKGWWRGKTQDRVGFFPKDYVREHPQMTDEL